MKIFSARQIRELDAYTIKHKPISSVKLMHRAALAFGEATAKLIPELRHTHIFCGMGNNGGDGMALANICLEDGETGFHVWVVKHTEKASADFTFFEKKVKKRLKVNYIENEQQIPKLKKDDLVIDAIFGSGLSRPVEGVAAKVIQAINRSGVPLYSVDMPSGLYCDTANAPADVVVEADKVFTFHAPKLSFFFPANENYVPKFTVLHIGLSEKRYAEIASPYEFIERETVASFFKKRKKFSHKGTYGHALIAAGSMGKMGAAILALRAAVRSGAGLVSAYVPGNAYPIIHTAVPEAMVDSDAQGKESVLMGQVPTNVNDYSAIGIGPGIGTVADTSIFFESLLKNYKRPLVIDADALNLMAFDKSLLKRIPAGSILTPHPGEFKRLVGDWKDDLDKLKKQIKFATTQQVVVVLKGAYTSIATPDGKVYFNPTGNPGMAKGGSGDVLTGVITSLLAQGYTSEQAALLGVYVHGLAGDIARDKLGETSMTASDIIDCLSDVFLQLENPEETLPYT